MEGPTLGKSIFFHETSCFGDSELLLNPREACAVESAALMNPNLTIYLLFLSGSKVSISAKQLIQHLLLYKNIKIRRINIDKYIKNTPLENWYATGILKTSKWPRNHMSDIMRYLTLWKYGGIYMDLDVVVIKCLEDLENFTGAQDANDVAAGVIGFGMNPLGRKMANDCIIDLKNNFLGWAWGHNGPGVITRTLQRQCNATIAQKMTKDKCQGFQVFQPSVFYPIFYPSWKKYFVTNDFNATMKTIENSKAIHVWNKFSKTEKLQVGSNVPYGKIAEKYCPKTYKNCGKTF
ncbi:lactosylceramide 4-alpha-galactosyltransferase-like isoform X2 [Leptopilina heterotoma]|uniref:lactosylceramide 4-alpha-galactosyltransferase-like isoform X2 n=1 Tax=Leptopilina heterotoma TaxID=63436 RepID=UPI001CA951D8|nr:lactosylceramide 4-alpha-galactosyltransferase-like isoform X2 [Leptopilina heterotoma]